MAPQVETSIDAIVRAMTPGVMLRHKIDTFAIIPASEIPQEEAHAKLIVADLELGGEILIAGYDAQHCQLYMDALDVLSGTQLEPRYSGCLDTYQGKIRRIDFEESVQAHPNLDGLKDQAREFVAQINRTPDIYDGRVRDLAELTPFVPYSL